MEKIETTDGRIIPYTPRKDNYQPNALTIAKRSYTLNEQRLFFFIINQFNHLETYDPNQNLIFRIPISEITKSVDYKELKDLCKTFKQKGLYEKDENGEFQSMTVFPWVKYDGKTGIIQIMVLSNAIPLFVNLGKEYTRYNVEAMLSLTSKYSQRIFEILRMFQGRKQQEFSFDFLELKESLCCEKYTYKDFRVNVLEVAQKELYDKAGITFDFNTGDKQRGIDKINFKIVTWNEIATKEVTKEVADYLSAPETNQYNGVHAILKQSYTFNDEQIKTIINDPTLREKFVEIHSLIEVGKVKISTTPTKYMAKVLGFAETKIDRKRKLK
jgi:plasmid replication initiation protein